MAYGIYCYNTSGELTLSSDALTMGYLGKATLVSVVSASGTSTDSQAGYATWQYSSTGPIIAAIGLKGGSAQVAATIMSIYRHDSSTWYIQVRDLTTSLDTQPDGASYNIPSSASDIYVFGLPTSLPAYGVALYDSNGNLSGDLLRRPFAIASRVALADSVMSTTIPSLTKPAVVGFPNTNHTLSSSGHGGVNPWLNTSYKGAWSWDSGTTLSRGDFLYTSGRSDGGIPVITNHGPCTALVIEANGLT